MQMHSGKRRERPAPRNRLVIQERDYATQGDFNRALTAIHRYWGPRGVLYNAFSNGKGPSGAMRLYFARKYTAGELLAAGYDPETFYDG